VAVPQRPLDEMAEMIGGAQLWLWCPVNNEAEIFDLAQRYSDEIRRRTPLYLLVCAISRIATRRSADLDYVAEGEC
jgi:hypothetical protein